MCSCTSTAAAASASCLWGKLGTHLGVNLQTNEDRAMWKLLQDYRVVHRPVRSAQFLGHSAMSTDRSAR